MNSLKDEPTPDNPGIGYLFYVITRKTEFSSLLAL